MLWIYSQNDHYFPPSMATMFDEAYKKGGGKDEFVMAPPNGEDGHHLYAHPDAWSDMVTAFLSAHGLLPLGEKLLPPPPVPDVPAPPGLNDKGEEAWKRFVAGAPYKAFAMTGDGLWGSATGEFNQSLADEAAMDRCKKAGEGKGNACHVVSRTSDTK